MPTSTLKVIIAAILILGHLAAMAVCLMVLSRRYPNVLELILVLSPVFTLYSIAVFRDMARNAQVDPLRPDPPLSKAFSFFSILFVSAFCIGILYVMKLFVDQTIPTDSIFRQWLSGIEVVLGGYLGVIMDTLFPTGDKKDDRSPRQKPDPNDPSTQIETH
jgi:hypothetical protein